MEEINRLRKGINRLLSKSLSNIFLKVTIEKNWRSQNFDFLSLRNLSPGHFLGSSNPRRYHWTSKLLFATEKSEVWEWNCCLFNYFNFKRNYDILKTKSPCILLNKNMNFNKNGRDSKMENPAHSFKDTNLVLQLM